MSNFKEGRKARLILEAIEVSKKFNGIQALSCVSCKISQAEILGLIGPNGSGKSTFLNSVAGVFPISAGKIILNGKNISEYKAYQIARMGVGRTFQGGVVVPTLNCIDNVLLGFSNKFNYQLIRGLTSLPLRKRRSDKQYRKKALELLESVGLQKYKNEWARDLVWVQKQKLQIARSLANKPDLLLLDEPTAGMGKKETEEIELLINQINKSGVSVILISHDIELVAKLSSKIIVLMSGKKICDGRPDDVLSNPIVREAYLGT